MQIQSSGARVVAPTIAQTNNTDISSSQFANELGRATDAVKDTNYDKKLKATCRDLEAVFMNMMWSRMRATVPKSNLMGDSSKEEIIRSMLDTEMTKNLAQAGGVGLADMLYRQLSTTSSAANNGKNSQAPK